MHEIRDPTHDFIEIDDLERRVVNSTPIQRLRHIHQLALTSMVYPGATHRRFEHSLGVMHLAGKVFDVITEPRSLHPGIAEVVPQVAHDTGYSRRLVRLAALCHDIGHLPFSHAAEHDLLPPGESHETLTRRLIEEELSSVLDELYPPIDAGQLAKIAVGPEKARAGFSTWEALLAEIVVGDAFGVDRMDYLLRDSLHAGVAYGTYDVDRLVQTLRILPQPDGVGSDAVPGAPALGIEEGGLHSAEALLLARYFMFQQVYMHHVRQAYDEHLARFLLESWPDGYPVDRHLETTDNEVLVSIRAAARNEDALGHVHARRIHERDHFKLVYARTDADLEFAEDPGERVEAFLAHRYSAEQVARRTYTSTGGNVEFPVLMHDGTVASSTAVSQVLAALPVIRVDIVVVDPAIRDEVRALVRDNRRDILTGALKETP